MEGAKAEAAVREHPVIRAGIAGGYDIAFDWSTEGMVSVTMKWDRGHILLDEHFHAILSVRRSRVKFCGMTDYGIGNGMKKRTGVAEAARWLRICGPNYRAEGAN